MKRIEWKRIQEAYVSFIEGKGFGLIVTVCVAIITATAVWTERRSDPYTPPTPPVYEEHQASVQMQQSIRDVSTPTPLPSVSPVLWHAPLSTCEVLTACANDMPIHYESTGLWALHTGIDLHAALGAPVYAMADGKVIACGEDPLLGVFVHIEHAEGYETHYSGLSMISALQTGDRIRAGQTLGFVGNSIPSEAVLGPHLHLELLHHGDAVDPAPIIPKQSVPSGIETASESLITHDMIMHSIRR